MAGGSAGAGHPSPPTSASSRPGHDHVQGRGRSMPPHKASASWFMIANAVARPASTATAISPSRHASAIPPNCHRQRLSAAPKPARASSVESTSRTAGPSTFFIRWSLSLQVVVEDLLTMPHRHRSEGDHHPSTSTVPGTTSLFESDLLLLGHGSGGHTFGDASRGVIPCPQACPKQRIRRAKQVGRSGSSQTASTCETRETAVSASRRSGREDSHPPTQPRLHSRPVIIPRSRWHRWLELVMRRLAVGGVSRTRSA